MSANGLIDWVLVEKKAVNDHKGKYQSVVAKGKVKFVKGQGVFVEEYFFMKSG